MSSAAENLIKFIFHMRHLFRSTMFLLSCRLNYCDCQFLQNGNSFNMTYRLISLLALKERKRKQIELFVAFFSRLEYFCVLVVGTREACYWYLVSEADNCTSAVCTSTNCQRGAPIKRSQ
jgi:hypothetical protein